MVPKSFIREYTKFQKELINDISRDVIVGLNSTLEEKCPNCFFDYTTGSSSSSFTNFSGSITLFSGTAYERVVAAKSFKQRCPVCKGDGLFKVPNELTIPVHVVWETGQRGVFPYYPNSEVGFSGQNIVTLKTDSRYFSLFTKAKYFIVDGVRVAPRATPVLRGMGSNDGIVELVCETITTDKLTQGGV